MKNKKLIIPLLVLSSIMCGCSNNQTIIESKSTQTIEEESMMPIANNESSKLSKEQWQLITDDESICFSPISLKYAMILLQAAANDEESINIGSVLGQNITENFLKTSKQSIDFLNETGIVNIANAVVADDSFTINKDYVDDIQTYLSSNIITTKLGSPEGQEKVNIWMYEHTNGKIKSFKIDESTRVLLMNAIYYKDKWDLFDKENTEKRDFYSLNGTQQVDTMIGTIKNKSLYKGKNYEMIEIGLENSSMSIYLPNDGVSLTQVANELATENTNEEEYFDIINISLPKFKMEQEYNLNSFVSNNLGLDEIFYGNNLFPKISNENLQVDEIIQKTFIEINEEGAEAAATTIITMKNSASIIEDVKKYDFFVNRPFLYEIKVDGETLFLGSVLEID